MRSLWKVLRELQSLLEGVYLQVAESSGIARRRKCRNMQHYEYEKMRTEIHAHQRKTGF